MFWLTTSIKKEISALGAAAHEGNIAIMDILFRNRAVINQSFSGGMDAGWLAMENHKYEAFDWLVSKGLNLNNRLIETSETRLISAVKNSDLRMVSRLLQLRVNPQDSDIEGRTALHYNLAKNPFEIDDLKIGELLLAENCDPNRQDKHGLSSHAYIKDDQAFTLLNSYELDKVNKVALKRMEAREEAIKSKNEKKATPEKVANKKQNKKSNAKAKPKKYYPK